jgi:Tfp pilus assembly protein PilN
MKAVNLLPNDRGAAKTAAAATPSAPGGGAFGAYVVLAALVFAVVAMAAYVLTTNSIKDRKSELAAVTKETQETQAKAAALQSFADFKALADQRVTTVTGLASSRFDWERTLTDLSKALPSDVHLKSLRGTTGTEVGGGGATRGAIQAPALEMSGCTSSQSAVARLMSRLRNVRGVTRVALTKSEKAAEAVVATTGTDGSNPGSLCPKGSPPAFDLVMFFERAAVAAGASPNVGASAPSTSTTQAPAAAAGAAGTTAAPAGAGTTGTAAPGAAPTPAAATPADATTADPTGTTQGASAR